MNECKKLIEVALPIREISAESVRDKSLRHGHISTLHLWWARRPLPASRAVVFASLVPDPDDPQCPEEFCKAVERLLKTHIPSQLCYYNRGRDVIPDEDPYRPYEGMPDTLRNRLLMFIAKWSPEALDLEKGKRAKPPKPAQLLDDRSLVKWETSNPENPQGREILRVARELIKIAHDGKTPTVLDLFAGGGAIPLEAGRLGCQPIANDYNPVAYLILLATCEFPQKYGKSGKRKVVTEEFGKTISKEIDVLNVLVHDVEKWAKWILERAREKIGHLYPHGKDLPAPRPEKYFVYVIKCSDDSLYIGQTDNILRHYEEHQKGKISWTATRQPLEIIHWEELGSREEAVEREKHLKTGFGRKWLKREYMKGRLAARQAGGKPVVCYLWARTAPCSNPSCRGEIPLLRSLLVCNKKDKKVALTMEVDKELKDVKFGIAEGDEIEQTNGTMQNRGNVLCPYCEQVTPVADLRRAGLSGQMGERMVAVIEQGKGRKDYRPVDETEHETFHEASLMEVERPQEKIYENIAGIPGTCIISPALYYGMPRWGDLFNPRQLLALQTFIECLHEALEAMEKEFPDEDYRSAVGTYLGLWISRIAQRSSNVGIWHTSRETLEHPFGRQAIPMTWDYPEANPFSDSTGGALGGIRWIKRVLLREFNNTSIPCIAQCRDGAELPQQNDSVDIVVTDPPYFDSIAYSDLSDYFYVWLKRALSDVIPEILVTPLTPKADEATALKHRHDGETELADRHFTQKLAGAFSEAKRVIKPGGVVTIMFAHQSTKAWTALIHAIFEAGLTVDSTWPIDTELISALKASMSALSSSITVTCRPRITGTSASFKDVRKEIEKVVKESVKRFWGYGFRGADLVVACYGPAVGVFGKYERVEKADGTPVEIPELLVMARKAARDAIAGEFKGDSLSTLYYVWANLYGASEQAWDDARLVVQIGGESENAMEIARGQGIFVVDGSRCRLALLADRADRRGLGVDINPPFIDALHRSMLLWKQEKRGDLVSYLTERGLMEDGPFWKLAQALFEVMPRDTEDWKLTNALLSERETLRIEGKRLELKEDTLFNPLEGR